MKSVSPPTQPRPLTFLNGVRPAGSPLITQITQFLMSGGFSTLIHWTVMALLTWQGLDPVLATMTGALFGAVLNYISQFYWTFNGMGIHGKAIPAYACTVVLGWCINAGLFYFLISFFHAGLGSAQVSTTAALAVMNFFLYKRIVFHERIGRKLGL